MNNGLYAFAGASATATAAAWANRLLAPMTKVSKVYFALSRAGSLDDRLGRLSHRWCAGSGLGSGRGSPASPPGRGTEDEYGPASCRAALSPPVARPGEPVVSPVEKPGCVCGRCCGYPV